MPTPTSSRTRLTVAAAALLLGLGLVAWPMLAAPKDGVIGPGAAGALLLAVGLVLAEARLVPFGLGLIAAEFLVALAVLGRTEPFLAVLWGAGLLLVGELADWSFELALPTRDDPGLKRRRAATIGGLVLAAAVAGGAAAGLGQVPVTGGLWLAAAGVGAVVALLVGAVLAER